MIKFKPTLCILGFLVSSSAWSAVSPIAIATVPAFQFPPENSSIFGARLSLLWGQHDEVYGFDLGLIGNISNKKSGGISMAGLFNKNNDVTIVGAQLAGLTNMNSGTTRGVGIQAAFGANFNAKGDFIGLQLSPANISPDMNLYGVQVGGFNRADHVFGVQIGIVNMAKSLHGLQIGVLNINKSGPLGVFPILNIGI